MTNVGLWGPRISLDTGSGAQILFVQYLARHQQRSVRRNGKAGQGMRSLALYCTQLLVLDHERKVLFLSFDFGQSALSSGHP